MGVYVLCFERPVAHAKHYIGFVVGGAEAKDRRLKRHLAGRGNPLVCEAGKRGAVRTAKFWAGGCRNFERWLKNRRDVSNWCPICARGKRSIPTMAAWRRLQCRSQASG